VQSVGHWDPLERITHVDVRQLSLVPEDPVVSFAEMIPPVMFVPVVPMAFGQLMIGPAHQRLKRQSVDSIGLDFECKIVFGLVGVGHHVDGVVEIAAAVVVEQPVVPPGVALFVVASLSMGSLPVLQFGYLVAVGVEVGVGFVQLVDGVDFVEIF
jgi:hypothetical protein